MPRTEGSLNKTTIAKRAKTAAGLRKQQERASEFFGFTLPKKKQALLSPNREASDASAAEPAEPAVEAEPVATAQQAAALAAAPEPATLSQPAAQQQPAEPAAQQVAETAENPLKNYTVSVRNAAGSWRPVNRAQWQLIEKMLDGPLGLVFTGGEKPRFVSYLDGTPNVQGKPLKRRRAKESRIELRAFLREHNDLTSGELAVLISKHAGYGNTTPQMVRTWRRGKKVRPTRRVGKPVDTVFERAVLDDLVYSETRKINGKDELAVVANTAYSYEIIKAAAQKISKRPEFLESKLVQALEFSNKWVQGWLRRQVLRRRRVTADEKTLPSVPEIQAGLEHVQKKICGLPTGDTDDEIVTQGAFDPADYISADETGFFYGAPPINQYVSHEQKRGAAPESDNKARLTSLQSVRANGEHIGSFNIIKCGCKDPYNLSKATVISKLHDKPGFDANAGWEMGMWERTLMLRPRGNKPKSEGGGRKDPVARVCKRPYLINRSGSEHVAPMTVVTVQKKAWMDAPGVAMWTDLCLSHFPRMLVIWDNCGPHK
eukprot:COSAG02_NODE_11732_length_1665_cov_2.138570_1_plen_544_part_01